jgi:sulfur carrier protein ThiS
MEVEIPEGAAVKDLLTVLKVGGIQGIVVMVGGQILKTADRIRGDVPVGVFQAIHGG